MEANNSKSSEKPNFKAPTAAKSNPIGAFRPTCHP